MWPPELSKMSMVVCVLMCVSSEMCANMKYGLFPVAVAPVDICLHKDLTPHLLNDNVIVVSGLS